MKPRSARTFRKSDLYALILGSRAAALSHASGGVTGPPSDSTIHGAGKQEAGSGLGDGRQTPSRRRPGRTLPCVPWTTFRSLFRRRPVRRNKVASSRGPGLFATTRNFLFRKAAQKPAPNCRYSLVISAPLRIAPLAQDVAV